MRGFLILPSKASQWASFLVAILAASGVTFFLIAAVSSFNQTSIMFRTADEWNLDHSLIYSILPLFQLSDEEKQTEREKILSVNGVADVNIVSTYKLYLPTLFDAYSITFLDYSEPLLQDIHYKLTSGSYPEVDQGNQILLPSRFRSMCKVGDTLTGYDFTYSTEEDSFDVPISVTVAGFLDEQPVLNLSQTSTGVGSLSDHFTWRDALTVNGIENSSGVVYSMYGENGKSLSPSPSSFYLIRSDGSVPLVKLKEDLSKVVMSPTFLHGGTDMIQTYIEQSRKEIAETLALCVTSIFISFSLLTASTLLELIYRKKEMATLYLCGTSWNNCVWTILAGQILPIAIGFPIGLFLFAKSSDLHLFYILSPQLELTDVLVVLILQIIFVALAIIPFRLSTKYKTPYELFRKD